MDFKFRDIFEKVKSWFPQKTQARIEAQAAELEERLDKKDFIPLSSEECAYYRQKIESLPLPEVYKNALKAKISEVLFPWIDRSSTENCLFILFNPIEPIQPLFKEILEQVEESDLPRKYLNWEVRPEELNSFPSQLQSQIYSLDESHNDPSQSIVIIPDLGSFFLRCIEGLDTVEYLFDRILKDQSRFWLIGCNQWAWKYFDCIYKVSGCFQEKFYLPTLNAIELKKWLTPVYEDIELEFDVLESQEEDSLKDEQEEEKDWISKKEKRYFERLANVSEGLSQAAAHLWLDSLRYVQTPDSDDQQEKHHYLKRVLLPKLPEIDRDERYLLASIGLHREISLSDLILSLGEKDLIVRMQLQKLLKIGVIVCQNEQIFLEPTYYSRLKRDLMDNRILVGDES
ncbi:MAG: hypothetical protein SWJ54_08630 [Cyanobacteriota bacterium]|nr:hypothetical protein [Cyanobacteriota bacterium]